MGEQVRLAFSAQRDKLFGQVKHIAVEQARKEVNIERRVSIVLRRLKSEQLAEMRTINSFFREHLIRTKNFILNAGKESAKSEQFQPFKALGTRIISQSSNETGSKVHGSGTKTTKKKIPFPSFLPQANVASLPLLEPSGLFEFAAKLLSEEMRILEHKRMALPERIAKYRNASFDRKRSIMGDKHLTRKKSDSAVRCCSLDSCSNGNKKFTPPFLRSERDIFVRHTTLENKLSPQLPVEITKRSSNEVITTELSETYEGHSEPIRQNQNYLPFFLSDRHGNKIAPSGPPDSIIEKIHREELPEDEKQHKKVCETDADTDDDLVTGDDICKLQNSEILSAS